MAKRSSGILAHITSLPGPYGIGDLQSACDFLDFLARAGQRYWQFLPTGPCSEAFGFSPYTSLSAFAGNPLLISPEILLEKRLITGADLEQSPYFSEYAVDFSKVAGFRESLLEKAFHNFFSYTPDHEGFARFCAAEQEWLDDFALFMSLRERYDLRPWHEWPKELASRDKKGLADAARALEDSVNYHRFVQFLFFEQWRRLRQKAEKRGIRLIGDIPIYVGLDSADVWANQACFDLNRKTLKPRHVAGVPPDYFSETGQRWGNPLYMWKVKGKHNELLYEWWRRRFRKIGSMVDVVRIDHFRGFASFWQIPAAEETAIKGKWIKGPGQHFFKEMGHTLDGLTIIAEDLGLITPDVVELLDSLGFPGMKVLLFAFDSDHKNIYLPYNYENPNCVVYTGTHDNDTVVGWYYDENVNQRTKDRVKRYANSDGSAIHRDFIRLAFSSVAGLAIVPLQDVLGFGNDCRMNRPSTTNGNWVWRCAPRFLTDEISTYLKSEVRFYGRLPDDEHTKGRGGDDAGLVI